MRNRARIVAIAGLLCSVTCVALLHVVRTDLPPVAHRLSEYANGPYGWMMTLAFVALGCALVALGVALRAGRDMDRITWIISATAFLAGLGTIVSGVFRTGTSQADEVIHSRASALATVAIVALALAYSIRVARRQTGPPAILWAPGSRWPPLPSPCLARFCMPLAGRGSISGFCGPCSSPGCCGQPGTDLLVGIPRAYVAEGSRLGGVHRDAGGGPNGI